MRRILALPSLSLAAKITIAGGALLVIGGGISWYALIQSGRENLMQAAVRSASMSSDLVKKSIRYDMLTVNRDGIQRTIEDVGIAEDIRRIRIFDNRGKVFASTRKGEIGRQVDRSSFACLGCHVDPTHPAETLTARGRWVTYRGREGYNILTFVDPIYNEPSCAVAACHVPPGQQRVLGILETDFSLLPLDRSYREQARDITLYAFLLLTLSSVILYAILRKFVFRPVASLATAMGRISAGDLQHTVPVTSADEMGLLARTFNAMTRELQAARAKMEQWTQTLEQEVAKKTEELLKSQEKLVRAEKLAALGRLTAEVAHEIRNPLTAIGGFARRLHKIAAAGKEQEYAGVILTETDRLEKILRDVLTFSRDARYHLAKHPIDEVIYEALSLYEIICSEQGITIEVQVEKNLPWAFIDRGQVLQALDNLLTNAIDAMSGGGTLKIIAGGAEVHDVGYLFISVADTGPGIPAQDLELIFEPFFSTKTIGHGTGLGLSITRKIMEEHGGFIKAESTPQKGSTISLYFPLQGTEASQGEKCWEYMKCGRDKDATEKCPAHPHFGRICWVVAGTFCEGKIQGTFAQKYENCTQCDFFRKLKNEREARNRQAAQKGPDARRASSEE